MYAWTNLFYALPVQTPYNTSTASKYAAWGNRNDFLDARSDDTRQAPSTYHRQPPLTEFYRDPACKTQNCARLQCPTSQTSMKNEKIKFSLPANGKDIKVVGELWVLADLTRIDIVFFTSRLSSYIHRPSKQNSNILHYAVKYLKTTRDHGILYENQ